MEPINNIIKLNEITKCEKEETEMEETCPYCGKHYHMVQTQYYIAGRKSNPLTYKGPSCNCLQLIKEREEEQKRFDVEIKRKREKSAKIFENSMITPFFKEKLFENLEETEEIKRCKQYAQEFNPKTSKGIQMFGVPGTGKTTALAAICNYLMVRDYHCLFTPLSTLLDKFSKYSYSNSGDVTDLLKWITAFDFVVLDDIGRETYTDKRKENVFRIIDTLMNYKVVTAFTANPEMIAKLKNIPELDAALDRLKEMCPIKFEFRGKSYRGKQ